VTGTGKERGGRKGDERGKGQKGSERGRKMKKMGLA